MKDALLPIACLAVLGGLVLFVVKRPAIHLSSPPVSNPASASNADKDKKSSVVKDGAKPAKSTRAHASAHPEQTNQPPTPQNVATPVAPVADQTDRRIEPLFPAVSQLAPGLDRSQLLDRFGNPDLEATTVDRGTLLETYLYRHKSDSSAVVVYMKDGRVERARTTP